MASLSRKVVRPLASQKEVTHQKSVASRAAGNPGGEDSPMFSVVRLK
jgi:hypothetical protein